MKIELLDVEPISQDLEDIKNKSKQKYDEEFVLASDGNIVIRAEIEKYEFLLQNEKEYVEYNEFVSKNQDVVDGLNARGESLKKFNNKEERVEEAVNNIVYGPAYEPIQETPAVEDPILTINGIENNTVYGPVVEPNPEAPVAEETTYDDISELVDNNIVDVTPEVAVPVENNNVEDELNSAIKNAINNVDNEKLAEEKMPKQEVRPNEDVVESILKLISGFEVLAEQDPEEVLLKIDALKLKINDSNLYHEQYEKVMNKLIELENATKEKVNAYQKTLVNS